MPRHPQVHQHHVGRQPRRQLDRLARRRRPRRPPRSPRLAGEHAAQPVAHDRVVVDDQQPDQAASGHRLRTAGTLAEIAVPRPARTRSPASPASRLDRAAASRPARSRRRRRASPGRSRRRRRARPARPRPPCRTASARRAGAARAWRRWPAPPGPCAAASPRHRPAAAAASPVVETARGTPLQRRPAFGDRRPAPRAGGAASSGCGPQRLHRPARLGQALAGQLARRVEVPAPAARRRDCSAAWSWVTMPVSPCASVSWISRAIRAARRACPPRAPGRAAARAGRRSRAAPPRAGAAARAAWR